MDKNEQNFETFIKNVAFNDTADDDHKQRLEKQLLDAYDNRADIQIADESATTTPTAQTYLFRVGVAAAFLIVATLVVWLVNTTKKPARQDPNVATQNQQQTIEVIYKNTKDQATTKTQITAQLKKVWSLAHQQDANGLVSLMHSGHISGSVKRYAVKYVAQFGNQQTLTTLDIIIETNSLTDPNDPFVIAAQKLRQKLKTNKTNQTD